MNSSPEISVVIVNFYTSKHIENLLLSLEKLRLIDSLEIIIVDNSENDEYLKHILLNYRDVKLFKAISNDGFGAACNVGAKNATGEYIAFVNPDTMFITDIFMKLKNFALKNTSAAFIGGLLVNEKNEPIYSFNSFPGYYWELLQAAGMGTNKEIQKLIDRKEVKNASTPFEVDWLIGAFLFVHKKIFDELNGFDERFFLYYEDVDIQYRAQLLGYKNFCIPDLRLFHSEQGSVKSERGDDVYHFYMYKSKMMYYYLHFPFIKRNALRIFLIGGLFFRMLVLFPRKSFTNKKKKFKQYMHVLRFFVGTKKTVFADERI